MKRARRREEADASAFDPDTFRRQSQVLSDEPPSGGMVSRSVTMNRGGMNNTPRPPSMFEQRMHNNAPVSFGNPNPYNPHPYAAAGPQYGGYQQPSFVPGEVVSMSPGPMSPPPQTPLSVVTPNSTVPFFAPMGQSPMGSPVAPSHYDSAYNDKGELIRKNSAGPSAAFVTRQPSLPAEEPLQQPDLHYVDLSRSSVTPFQAQQYEEISRRLNTAPPMPVSATIPEHADMNEEMLSPKTNTRPLDLGQNVMSDQHHLPVVHDNAIPESPFADPHFSGVQQQQHRPASVASQNGNNSRESNERDRARESFQDTKSIRDSFPVPPSPAFSSNTRITSTPPVLPEITIQQRSFSPISSDFPSSVQPSPSPLALSFSVPMPSPPADAHLAAATEKKAVTPVPEVASVQPQPRPLKEEPAPKRPDTVYTMYDDEDAYAGI
ncbi:hypothetical protein K474DRAFT_668064 [Panus rudis PR-1116 ss-1]|nr:hypothetical protein K474DRAFT_668064 [Panus rudis PR-1116 ss-1]